MSGGDTKKKRIAVMGVSLAMLTAMIVAVIVGIKTTSQGTYVDGSDDHGDEHGGDNGDDLAHSNKAVHSLCKPTDYHTICEKSLGHTNTSDPKQLVTTGFNAAIIQIESALKHSSTLKAVRGDPRTAGALETCKEVMEYGLGDIKRSVNTMEKFDFGELADFADNIKTWLSGALTYQDTCIDAFENTTGDTGLKMKHLLNVSRELTSNGLAMATELTALFSSVDIPSVEAEIGRYLKENKGHQKTKKEAMYPHWVDIGRRKLLKLPVSAIKADVVVAKDGSGKYKTIIEALKDIPLTDPNQVTNSPNKTFVIYIKEGVYVEQIRVEVNMMHVMFVGDGPDKTILTGNKSFADGLVVYKTATVSVMGNNFIAKDLTFENTAGPSKHQAVALLVQSDMSIFYNCHINGYRSTLYANSYRQFYRHSHISGTVDILFGDAAVVFQNCRLVIRKPLDEEKCYVAAHGRNDHKASTGFILQNCTFSADPLYYPLRQKNKAYFGRPWKKYSRMVIMQSFVDDAIDPQGWAPWMGTLGTDTCYFAEFENRGPGAATLGRVKWPGVKANVNVKDIEEFTPGKFLDGNKWILPSHVPYEAGMLKI